MVVAHRLDQLSDELQRLRTERVQIDSMILSVEQFIADELLDQVRRDATSGGYDEAPSL
jgi:hypothetical protein